MKNRIKIRVSEDNHYVIKSLYRKNINIYNIEYSKNGNIYTILEEDLEKILIDDIDIISYRGFKGFLFKLKRHKHFLISFFMNIIVIFLLSNVVVDINVIHSDKNIRDLVEEELSFYGINPFMLKKSFNELQKIKYKIKSNHPDQIEWLEIIDEGMKYSIRIEERIITKEENKPLYCDVISSRDAIVQSIVSSVGQNQVFDNDFVRKGDTLISGAIKFNEEIKAYTCASGVVYGNTWYTVNISVPYNYDTKKYTEKKSHNIAILNGSNLIEMFKVHLDKYETTQKKLFSLGNFTLFYETHKEYKIIKNKYSEEEALNKALELGRKKILLNLENSAEILSEKVLQRNSYDSIIEVEIFYSIKERIDNKVERNIPESKEGVINESS